MLFLLFFDQKIYEKMKFIYHFKLNKIFVKYLILIKPPNKTVYKILQCGKKKLYFKRQVF